MIWFPTVNTRYCCVGTIYHLCSISEVILAALGQHSNLSFLFNDVLSHLIWSKRSRVAGKDASIWMSLVVLVIYNVNTTLQSRHVMLQPFQMSDPKLRNDGQRRVNCRWKRSRILAKFCRAAFVQSKSERSHTDLRALQAWLRMTKAYST